MNAPQPVGDTRFDAAAAAQMETLVADLGQMYQERNEALREVVAAHQDTLYKLALAAEYKDDDTGVHIVRIGVLAEALALALGQSRTWSTMLRKAAPMHDIGKIGIPDAILRKNGKLEPHEWDVMRSHVEIGVRIIGEHAHGVLRTARTVALTHHEKWDGSGYPNRIAGEQIPLEGRIVAIADVFDALTSERPYKRAWPVEQALDLLREQSGKHFDPALVELFMTVLPAILEVRDRFPEDSLTPASQQLAPA